MTAACSRCAASFLYIAAVSCFLLAPLALGQQKAGQSPQGIQQSTGTITVSIRLPDGSPFDRSLLVNLYTFTGASAGIASMRGGQAEFANLPIGRYTLEVIAPGYEELSQPVEIAMGGQHEQVFVTLAPEFAPNTDSVPSASPILAPNAQKEFNKALEALRANKPEEAKKHLEKSSRAAPSNPDVNYLWGMYYLQRKDLINARSYWEKAVQIYPRHGFSLAALGQLAVERGDWPAAIDYLGRAVEAAPSSWRFQERLAQTYLLHQEYEQAQKHAERAIELGKDRASQAQFILAQALVQRNEPVRASKALDTLLAAQPSPPEAAQAQRLRDALRGPSATARPAAPAPGPLTPALLAPTPLTIDAIKPVDAGLVSLADELMPPQKWMPPDIDESMPAVEPGVACPLQTVQEEAGKRVRDFVDAVNRISATESLEDETIDQFGFPARHESRSYSYVASVQEIRPGMYDVEEYRNGTIGLDIFPARIATLGLSSLVMVFHPTYRDDYEVSCEGLSRWHGGLAWQVHFRQRADKPARMREYRVRGQTFPVSLRGRAWIAADTFQVVSLETDIVAPIAQIKLKAEHTNIEYTPVKFSAHNQELWLPQSAELFFDYGGHRMHRRHHFRDYMLFSVDERQKISAPKIDSESDPDPASPH